MDTVSNITVTTFYLRYGIGMDRAKWEVPKIAVMMLGTIVVTFLLVLFAELN
jgi:hypothetical protein